jgi:hypothetical protein
MVTGRHKQKKNVDRKNSEKKKRYLSFHMFGDSFIKTTRLSSVLEAPENIIFPLQPYLRDLPFLGGSIVCPFTILSLQPCFDKPFSMFFFKKKELAKKRN